MNAAIDLELFGRLAIAAISGGMLGVHFDLRARPGGFRAHALAAIGAALFCASARELASVEESVRAIQGIATGVGFIGAATVLRGTGGSVQGVASAATIWISAALGCLAAFGNWRVPLAVAAFVAVLNGLGFRAERAWLRKHRRG